MENGKEKNKENYITIVLLELQSHIYCITLSEKRKPGLSNIHRSAVFHSLKDRNPRIERSPSIGCAAVAIFKWRRASRRLYYFTSIFHRHRRHHHRRRRHLKRQKQGRQSNNGGKIRKETFEISISGTKQTCCQHLLLLRQRTVIALGNGGCLWWVEF